MGAAEKTGNRKCWHMVNREGYIVAERLTHTEAMAKERFASSQLHACRDGYLIVECDGPAHSNANIDHCMHCAPRWGFMMVPARITHLATCVRYSGYEGTSEDCSCGLE